MVITRRGAVLILLTAVAVSGCAAPKVDFAQIERPARAPELAAFDVFVGDWDWEAEVLNAEPPNDKWTGEAHWRWTLDDRYLHGTMRAETADADFEAAGVWSWHPLKKTYQWWMFNNWGYPQEGTASYDSVTKTWKMPFTSVGLDGTTSHGCYVMKATNANQLDWELVEYADGLQMVKKLEMKGVYKRQ